MSVLTALFKPHWSQPVQLCLVMSVSLWEDEGADRCEMPTERSFSCHQNYTSLCTNWWNFQKDDLYTENDWYGPSRLKFPLLPFCSGAFPKESRHSALKISSALKVTPESSVLWGVDITFKIGHYMEIRDLRDKYELWLCGKYFKKPPLTYSGAPSLQWGRVEW